MSISREYLDHATEALKSDSQQGVFGNRGLGKIKDESEALGKLDAVFRQFDVPFSSDGSLEQLRELLK